MAPRFVFADKWRAWCGVCELQQCRGSWLLRQRRVEQGTSAFHRCRRGRTWDHHSYPITGQHSTAAPFVLSVTNQLFSQVIIPNDENRGGGVPAYIPLNMPQTAVKRLAGLLVASRIVLMITNSLRNKPIESATLYYNITPCPEERCHYILPLTLLNVDRMRRLRWKRLQIFMGESTTPFP